MGDVSAIWAAAKRAAEALVRPEGASIHLGCSWSAEDVAELARLAGVQVKATLYGTNYFHRRPYVIFSATAHVGGVEVKAQGWRDATAEDAGEMLIDGPSRYVSPEEARAAIEAARV